MPTDHLLLSGLWALFSIDIAASTPLKVDKPDEWSFPIIRFLQLAPQQIATHWPDGRAEFGRRLIETGSATRLKPDMPAPAKWKQLGDEVVFVQDLENANAVEFLYSVQSFIQTLRDVRRSIKRSFGGLPLPLKGTVWLANKARNIMPDSAGTMSGEKEYLGPGVDVGFRIKRYATDKKIALSIEAAYLLARGLKDLRDEMADSFVNDGSDSRRIAAPVIYLEGNLLPGVFGQRGNTTYPEILLRFLPWWEDSAHRRLVNRRKPVTASDLERVCREWMRKNRRYLFVPFRPEVPTGAVRPFLRSRTNEDYDLPP